MRFRTYLSSAVIAGILGNGSFCLAQTKDGAMLGGVAGAVIGGIVGHQNDETPEGALIGGAVGAIAGGMIGNHRQQQERIRYYEQQSRYYQPQPHYYHPPVHVHSTQVYSTPAYVTTVRPAPVPVPVRRAVSVADVIALSRRGLSESVIANHIQSNGVVHQPTTDDVLTMHDAGVSDFIINEMMQSSTPTPRSYAVQPSTQPVTVREEVYVTPIDQSRPISKNATSTPYQRSPQLQPVPAYRQKF